MNLDIVQVVSAEYVFKLREAGDYYLATRSHPKNSNIGIVELTRPAINPEDCLVFLWTFANWGGKHSSVKFKSEAGEQHKIEFGSDMGGFKFTPNIK